MKEGAKFRKQRAVRSVPVDLFFGFALFAASLVIIAFILTKIRR